MLSRAAGPPRLIRLGTTSSRSYDSDVVVRCGRVWCACIGRHRTRRSTRATSEHAPTPHASFDSCDVGACSRIDSGSTPIDSVRHRRGRTTAMVSLGSGPLGDSGPRDNVVVVRQRCCRSLRTHVLRAHVPTPHASFDSCGVAGPEPPPRTTTPGPRGPRRRTSNAAAAVPPAPTRGSARPPRHASGDGCGTRRRDRPGSPGARGTPGTAGCAWSRPRSWSRRPRHDDRRAATPSASP
jgi:hypothetical protein